MNITLQLLRTALAAPDAPALFRGNELVADYGAFLDRVRRTAGWLSERGISQGDRVALFMRNNTDYLEWLLGALWIGAVVVPVNFKLHPRELDYILNDSGASLLVLCAEGQCAVDSGELSWCGPCVNTDDTAITQARRTVNVGVAAEPAASATEADAWLFYTSGTTGRPKGVVITHGNLLAMSMAYFVSVDKLEAADAMLYAAPMSHGAGLYAFPALMAGARHVVPASGGFSAAEVLDLAEQLGRICLFAAPTMVRRLVNAAEGRVAAIAGIKTVVYGGGPMYVADIRDALQVMGGRFAQIYGQGESPMTITAMSRAELADTAHPCHAARLPSVGRAQAPVELAVFGPDEQPVPAGTPGEIVVRGATVMKGYWRQPEATAKALAGGWLHTGDVGALSEDGYLTLLDRSKDMIISGGSNIYPREVEEVLLTCPGVAEACVVGVPDPEWGEAVVAYLVVQAGQAAPAIEVLDAHCLGAVARFKRPRAYRFVEALPKNHYGKVLKSELRALHAQRHQGNEHAAD